jgi:hypothetical protein
MEPTHLPSQLLQLVAEKVGLNTTRRTVTTPRVQAAPEVVDRGAIPHLNMWVAMAPLAKEIRVEIT